jgi:hypothetical protein
MVSTNVWEHCQLARKYSIMQLRSNTAIFDLSLPHWFSSYLPYQSHSLIDKKVLPIFFRGISRGAWTDPDICAEIHALFRLDLISSCINIQSPKAIRECTTSSSIYSQDFTIHDPGFTIHDPRSLSVRDKNSPNPSLMYDHWMFIWSVVVSPPFRQTIENLKAKCWDVIWNSISRRDRRMDQIDMRCAGFDWRSGVKCKMKQGRTDMGYENRCGTVSRKMDFRRSVSVQKMP